MYMREGYRFWFNLLALVPIGFGRFLINDICHLIEILKSLQPQELKGLDDLKMCLKKVN